PNELLRLPNGEVILDHGADDPRLGVWLEPAKRPCVALRETSIDDRRLHGRMEVEQPERVRDGRSGSPDAGREVFLAEVEFVDEAAVRTSGLDRVEILALQVLDEGQLQLLPIRQLADNYRNPL